MTRRITTPKTTGPIIASRREAPDFRLGELVAGVSLMIPPRWAAAIRDQVAAVVANHPERVFSVSHGRLLTVARHGDLPEVYTKGGLNSISVNRI